MRVVIYLLLLLPLTYGLYDSTTLDKFIYSCSFQETKCGWKLSNWQHITNGSVVLAKESGPDADWFVVSGGNESNTLSSPRVELRPGQTFCVDFRYFLEANTSLEIFLRWFGSFQEDQHHSIKGHPGTWRQKQVQFKAKKPAAKFYFRSRGAARAAVFGFKVTSGKCENIQFGDIVYPGLADDPQPDIKGAGVLKHRWPNNQLVYELSTIYSDTHINYVHLAMEYIAASSCISFRPAYTIMEHRAQISPRQNGCFSLLGYFEGAEIFSNTQPLNLHTDCFERFTPTWPQSTPVHELLHALGFHHEHSRPDRDASLQVYYNNIPQTYWDQFDKAKVYESYNYGSKYDYESVMHYTAKLGVAKVQGTPVFARPDGTFSGIGGIKMTSSDFEQLNAMYGCTAASIPGTVHRAVALQTCSSRFR